MRIENRRRAREAAEQNDNETSVAEGDEADK